MNPYSGNTFTGFFLTFVTRLFQGFPLGLQSDELQFFVLATIALSSALVGVFLVWRQMSMLANALSHTILAGIVAAWLVFYVWSGFGADPERAYEFVLPDMLLLVAAIVMALITTFLTQAGVFLFSIAEDASTGVVFTFLFALGIAMVSAFTKNAHIGAELLMGNIDLVQERDLMLSGAILLFNALVMLLFFRQFVVTSLDPVFAHILGIPVRFSGYFLMAQVAVTAVAAFRAVGVILFLAFLVAPALAAGMWFRQHKKIVGISCFVGVFASIVGVALSRHLLTVYGVGCSTGALVVALLFFLVVVSMLVSRIRHFPLVRRS